MTAVTLELASSAKPPLSPQPPLPLSPLVRGRSVTTISKDASRARSPSSATEMHKNEKEKIDSALQMKHSKQIERIAIASRQRLLKAIEGFKDIYYLHLPKRHVVQKVVSKAGQGPTQTTEQQLFERESIKAIIDFFSSSQPHVTIFTYFPKLLHLLEDNWRLFPVLHLEEAEPQDQAWDFLLRVFKQMTPPQLKTFDEYFRREQMKELITLIQENYTEDQLLKTAQHLGQTNLRLDVIQEMRARVLTVLCLHKRELALQLIAKQVLDQRYTYFQSLLTKKPNFFSQDQIALFKKLRDQILAFKNDAKKCKAFQQALITDPNDILCPVYY